MSELSVHLLGTFHIDGASPLPSPLQSGKAQELFCYLLLHRDRPLLREMVAGTLWSDSPGGRARKYLRQALWQLQSGLDSLVVPVDRPLLHIEPQWVRLDSRAGLWLDISVLEQAMNATRGVPVRELTATQISMLRSAVKLYHGDLMEGWYQDWCLEYREAMQSAHLDILEKLVAHCASNGLWEEGIAFAHRVLHIDRAHERTHRQLMRLLYQSGDRTRALRQYDRCASALREELDVSPSKLTIELYEQLRGEGRPATLLPSVSAPDIETEKEVLAAVASELRQVQTRLAALETQVRIQLQEIEIVPVFPGSDSACNRTDALEA